MTGLVHRQGRGVLLRGFLVILSCGSKWFGKFWPPQSAYRWVSYKKAGAQLTSLSLPTRSVSLRRWADGVLMGEFIWLWYSLLAVGRVGVGHSDLGAWR